MRRLEVKSITAGYGGSQVLFDMSFEIDQGEIVTLLGRNGMGKTTALKALFGIVRVEAGGIFFEGKPIHNLSPYKIGRMGLALVPEGRQLFPNLTVRENIVCAAANRFSAPDPWTLESVIDLFPRIGERLHSYANQLSGGEQQMVAVARALMTNPKIIVLDEATEGLAPLIREQIWACLEKLKAKGQSTLLIDKNLNHLLKIGTRHFVIEKGRVVWQGQSEDLLANDNVKDRYIGV